MAHDFDDPENNLDNEEDLENMDSSSNFDDVPNIGGGFEDEDNDEDELLDDVAEKPLKKKSEDEIELTTPPTQNDGMKMMQTFQNIHIASVELSHLVNTTSEEVRKLVELVGDSNSHIGIVLNTYNAVHAKVQNTIEQTQEYLNHNSTINTSLEQLKTGIELSFLKLNTELEKKQEKYQNSIEHTTANIVMEIERIGGDINIEPIVKNLNKKIGDVVSEAAIKKLKATMEDFDKIYFDLEDVVGRLSGKKNETGLFKEFVDDVDKFTIEASKIKKRGSYAFHFFTSMTALLIGSFSTYIYSNSSFENRLANSLNEQSIKIHEKYADNFLLNKEEHKGYESFKKKYGFVNKDVGFGFFEDSKEPYFYFDKDMKTYKVENKIYIGL